MKNIILVLVALLLAMNVTLHISKTEATSIHIHSITFQDQDGQVIQSDLFAAGANLSNYDYPEAPEKEGFVFIGWSYDLSLGMPDASIVVVPEYILAEVAINHQI